VGQQCNDGNNIDWDGCTNGKITEFKVNLTVGGTAPDVAAYTDGSFIVVWTALYLGDIYSMTFSPEGIPVVGEHSVNEFKCKNAWSNYPRAAVDKQDTLGVVWTVGTSWVGGCPIVPCGSGSDYAVLADWPSPTKPAADICVAAASSQDQVSIGGPEIAMAVDGGFLVVWRYNKSGIGSLRAKRYDPDVPGEPSEFTVSTTTVSGNIVGRAVDTLSDGRFVAVYGSVGGNVLAQFLSSDGSLFGGEFGIGLAPNSGNVGVAANGDGGFVAAWAGPSPDGGAILVRLFGSDGLPDTNAIQVSSFPGFQEEEPDIVGRGSEGYVVVWRSNNQDGDGAGVFAQRLDQQGNKLGAEFQVNTYTKLAQTMPRVAALPAGGFIVVWESEGQDAGKSGIYAQRFDKDGNKMYH
jgi:hypothetical protein